MSDARLPPNLRCPAHQLALSPAPDADELACNSGCRFPVVGAIPRFVPARSYAAAFGLQWNRFRKTQLDSYTGTTVSRDRLARCLGGDLAIVRGKAVLEAGCGAGRFTEILWANGADVFAVDLSSAVDANLTNHREQVARGGREEGGYFVCQADILKLPVAPQSFDIVLSLGVIQHTPDPAATIRALAQCVAPGGLLVIDHYSHEYDHPPPRRRLRRALLRLPQPLASSLALNLSRGLLWLHRPFWRQGERSARIRRFLRQTSPLVDYYDSYSQLSRKILSDWCVLDTHDTVTDVFKHLRSVEEVSAMVRAAGMDIVHAAPGGNGVELRARPAAET